MIAVLGSVNFDLTFRLPHLPAAGETVLTPSVSMAVGGKGANQAAAAARDGAAVSFLGCVGSDPFAGTARAALGEAGVDTRGLASMPGATGLAAVLIDAQGRNQIAVASGANAHVRAAALEGCPLAAGALLVLQMEIPLREIERAIALGRSAGACIVLNLAPALPLPAALLSAVDVLVVNEHEAAALCAALQLPATAPPAQLAVLAGALGNAVILTLGAQGAIGARGEARWQAPPLPVTAVDTTGAGDCFVGVLAAALDRGEDMPQAMRRAAVAASLACTRVGALPSFPARAAIDAALAGLGPGPGGERS